VSSPELFKAAFPYASQDGAAILVSDIHRAKSELEAPLLLLSPANLITDPDSLSMSWMNQRPDSSNLPRQL